LKTTGAFAALLFLLALALGSHDAALGSSFTPIDHTAILSNPATSANSTVTVGFTLDSPHALDEAHVSFIPSAWSVANDAAVPDGAIVGTLSLSISESVSNSPCNDSKFLSFTLYEATTNTASNLLPDNPWIPDPLWPGFVKGANNLADAIDRYPTFLTNVYPGLTPRSRAYGSVDAAIAGINRVVNVLVFNPGTALPGMSPISASLGYIVVVVAQDPMAPAASSSITDQCSPFVYTRQDRGTTGNNPDTPADDAGPYVYRTNPATAGTYSFFEYLRSHRDFDNDGIENRLDACPYVSTPSWNPRTADVFFDPDGDGIPGQNDQQNPGQLLAGTGCDPTPTTSATDPDMDGFTNRQDNCALVANATQADPDADGIGSACDTVDTVPDGHLHEVCSTANVNVGAAGTPPTLTCPEYALDMDSDGFVRTVEEWVGTGAQDSCGNDGWPADLDSTGMSTNDIDVLDITSFLAPVRYLGTSPGDPLYDSPTVGAGKRWDLSPGAGVFTKHINVQDLIQLVILYAPMQEGARSLNGPPCPWP